MLNVLIMFRDMSIETLYICVCHLPLSYPGECLWIHVICSLHSVSFFYEGYPSAFISFIDISSLAMMKQELQSILNVVAKYPIKILYSVNILLKLALVKPNKYEMCLAVTVGIPSSFIMRCSMDCSKLFIFNKKENTAIAV